MFVTESIMDHLAEAAKLPREVMQRMNLYQPDSLTHFKQKYVGFYCTCTPPHFAILPF